MIEFPQYQLIWYFGRAVGSQILRFVRASLCIVDGSEGWLASSFVIERKNSFYKWDEIWFA